MFGKKEIKDPRYDELTKLLIDKFCLSADQIDVILRMTESFTVQLRKKIASSSSVMTKIFNEREEFDQFAENMNSIRAGLHDISTNISDTHNYVNKLDNSIPAIEHITSSVQNVSEIVHDRMTVTKELQDAAKDGMDKVSRVTGIMAEIADNAKAIKNVISAIDDISEQTNLLAMNAAIEAAHAGSAGAGFAVVSNEIRKLSEDTKRNATNISNTIHSMMEILDGANQVVEDTNSSMKWISGKVQETAQYFQEIIIEIGTLSSNSSHVSDSAMHMTSSTDEIKTKIKNLHDYMAKVMDDLLTIESNFKNIRNASLDTMEALSNEMFSMNDMIASTIEIENVVRKADDISNTSRSKFISEEIPFATIILKHLNWVTRVRSLIDGKLDDKGISLGDHHACDLGKWIDNDAKKTSAYNSHQFKLMMSEHEQLHNIVKEVFTNRRQMSQKELEDKYTKLVDKSRNVIDLLSEMRNKIRH